MPVKETNIQPMFRHLARGHPRSPERGKGCPGTFVSIRLLNRQGNRDRTISFNLEFRLEWCTVETGGNKLPP